VDWRRPILGTVVGETLEPARPSVPPLRVYLAGGIALRGSNGRTITEHDLAGRQGRRVFVRLAAIHQPVPHVELADDLWETEWPPAWDVALRALISKLRAALASVGAPGALTSGSGAYAMHLPAGTWLDLDAAAEAIHRAETARSVGDLSAAGASALVARSISSRPLLPADEADWLELLRAKLADIRLRSLECLGEVWIARGDPALAARDAAEAIRSDPYRETAQRLMIRAHLAAGDHAAAAHAYEAFKRLLTEELGVEPSETTTEVLRAALRRG
jgi:SARP family transcriptional regulator, regulator of embCAB operon